MQAKFKALYLEMKQIAESSPAPLFQMYKDDLYKHDFDVVHHDLQDGDTFYWAVKTCGTYFTLADLNCKYFQELMLPKHAPERRHFLIEVSSSFEKGYQITEYTMDTIGAAVARVKIKPDRKPARHFHFDLLTSLEPQLAGSVLFSDFTCDKGATVYLNITNNSLSYVTCTGKTRAVGLPFSMNRKTGAYKLTGTSKFGHATLEQIKLAVFQRAQKKLLSQPKAA